MKIESYSMQASSERVFQSVDRLRYSSATAQLPLSRAADGGSGLQPYLEAVKYSPSDQMKAIIEEARAERLKGAPDRTAQASEAASKSARQNKYEAMLSILEALMQRLTGKKFIAYRALRLTNEGASGAGLSSSGASAAASAAYPAVGTAPADSASAAGNAPVAEVTLHLGAAPARTINVTGARLEASHYEKESLSYSAQGLVRTADGRSISIDVSLNMSREFAATLDQSFVSVEKATDPLIINLSGGSASLTATKYAFDLDLDGSADQISFAGEGSGFLALDKNGDGRINDGAELFGPSSGSGFGELGAYDSDRNGWIDENDAVFSKLLVWSKDSDGADLLISLKEADVGAIFLGDIRTEYSLGGYSAASDGKLRSTSVFLRESGGAGTVQHVDLSI